MFVLRGTINEVIYVKHLARCLLYSGFHSHCHSFTFCSSCSSSVLPHSCLSAWLLSSICSPGPICLSTALPITLAYSYTLDSTFVATSIVFSVCVMTTDVSCSNLCTKDNWLMAAAEACVRPPLGPCQVHASASLSVICSSPMTEHDSFTESVHFMCKNKQIFGQTLDVFQMRVRFKSADIE